MQWHDAFDVCYLYLYYNNIYLNFLKYLSKLFYLSNKYFVKLIIILLLQKREKETRY